MKSYDDKTHFWGKIWIWTAVLVIVMVPVAVCLRYGIWPEMEPLLNGLLGVAPIFWTVGVIEVITFTPMLGTAGTYLGFVTGNLTSMKVPSALSAMERTGVKPGTDEGEVISTIAIATCSIVATLVIAGGVLLLSFLTPILDSPVLKPAFDYILPALFGGLGVVYVSKNWKISVVPLVFMAVLFLAVPSLSGAVGILVPVGCLLSIGSARILYKRGKV